MEKGELKKRPQEKIFFDNLDGVRAIAAIFVIVSHIETHKELFGLKKLKINFLNLGAAGVVIFFVLSGFLITYLLLEEKTRFEKVNIKSFYIRRVLRIWPLYFVVLFFGFFVFPKSDSFSGLFLSVFFLPNIAFHYNLLPIALYPIWSIGTEEQFYLIHPHFFKIKKTKNIFFVLLLFFSLFQVINIYLKVYLPDSSLRVLYYNIRFDSMLLGALFSIIFFEERHNRRLFFFQKFFKYLFTKSAQIILICSFIGYFLLMFFYNFNGNMLLPIITAGLLVNLCEPKSSLINFRNKYFNQFGKITYGVYLLHEFPLFLVLYVVKRFSVHLNGFTENLLIYFFTFSFTVILAALSYSVFEKKFLNLKKKFA